MIGGMLVMTVLVVVAFAMGCDLVFFFDLPALIFVVGGTLVFLMATQPRTTFSAFIDALLGKSLDASRRVAVRHFCRYGAGIAPAFGCLGFLVGVVSTLAQLSDPAGIGPSMALSLLALLYGVGLSVIVFMPVAATLRPGPEVESSS